MIKFLIKKSFFDIWDNLIPTFITNIVFMGTVALYVFFVQTVLDENVVVFFIVSALFLMLFVIEIMAMASISAKWVRYDNFSPYAGLRGFVKGKVGHFAVFYIIVAFSLFCCLIIIPYYLSLKSYIGIILGVFLFWLVFVLFMSLLYYPALTYANEKGAFATLRDSLSLFFDNKAYSFFVLVNSAVVLLVSALSFFIIPGFMGLSLCLASSAKLLLIRNGYALEKHISRKDIDLRDMLEEENLNLGKRTFRNTLFPWKKEK